ncbi:hypothetical protein HZA33_00645 [Candidatus Pacearchaeota archaeon]|nr:hypothetical protein [Candidatus Pacearchaeota archaeon]
MTNNYENASRINRRILGMDPREIDLTAFLKEEPAQPSQPLQIPNQTYSFLTGDFGKAFLKEYKARAARDYISVTSPVLDALSYGKRWEVVEGSNPFAVVLANQILREQGLRTATQADLEKILKSNALKLKDHYEDTALVFRSVAEPNEYLALNMLREVKGMNGLIAPPIVIPLCSLELVNDANSPHGLAFKLREDTRFFCTDKLAHENNDKRFSETDKNGMPIFDEKGSRILYTTNSGLSRLFLGDSLFCRADRGNLADSSVENRIVVVKEEK